ncbi:MAG: hypothetical protein WD070_04380, partial [Pirellulaceae bacterium]
MEPFSIACTTCQARLRVRDESVIGQILTCPKCGSMVLVEPVPAAPDVSQEAEPSASTDSAIAHHALAASDASDAAFEDAASLFDQASEDPASPDLTETVEDLSVRAEAGPPSRDDKIAADESGHWEGDPVESDESAADALSELSPPPRPATDDVLLPNADWASAATVQWRNRVLLGIAGVVGVVLAVMLLVVFSGGDTSPATASHPTPPRTQPINDTSGLQAAEPEEAESPGTATEPAAPPVASESSADGPDLRPREGLSDDPIEPPIESPAESPLPSPAPARPEPESGVALPDAPASDEPPGLTPKEPITDGVGTGGGPSPLSETLREFGALLDETKEPANPLPEMATESPRPPASDEREDEPVARRTGARVVEVHDRLNDPVARIDLDGVPLVNFLRFISDYSTIPITLDADILRWARVSPITAVRLSASDTTVAEVLNQGLAPLGLEHRIEADQLFITRRPKNESGVRTVTFKVEDLVGDDAKQLQQLGTRIMDFVAPESWSSRGGAGTMTFHGSELVIEQSEAVQFEILGFCEKLRVARGLSKRSPYDASMFRLATRGEQADAKLAQAITLTYIRPAPLQAIVDRIAQIAKLHILIDWRALADAGWSPDAEVGFSVADQPAAKALATLLEPLDLAYRIVDESTLQVTTPAVLDSRLEIEFYRVPKREDDGAPLVQSARDALGPANFRDFGGGGQLAFDE